MPIFNKTYKSINRTVGKALHAYDMISEGDRIAGGISGGSDSLTMITVLNERLARTPINYKLFGIHIDLGFEGDLSASVEKYFRDAGLYLRIGNSDYGPLAHSEKNRENPCFLCSMLRRKRIFEIADDLKCNKIALGHNKDDIIETLFLNMFYSGEIRSMSPLQSHFNGRFIVMRPLAFTEKRVIRRFAKQVKFPDLINPCPSASNTKRREIKDMLRDFYSKNSNIKGNIFRSMRRPISGPLLRKE